MDPDRILAVLDLPTLATQQLALDEQLARLVERGLRLAWVRAHRTPPDLAAVERALVRATAAGVEIVLSAPLALPLGWPDVHARRSDPEAAALVSLASTSVHDPADLDGRLATAARWLLASPVWAPLSKPTPPGLLGVDGLRRVVERTNRPVFALGGVTPERLGSALGAGAWGVASLGPMCDADAPATFERLRDALAATLAEPSR